MHPRKNEKFRQNVWFCGFTLFSTSGKNDNNYLTEKSRENAVVEYHLDGSTFDFTKNILTEKSRENAMVTRFNFTKKMAKYIDKKVMKIQGIFHEKRKWPKIF